MQYRDDAISTALASSETASLSVTWDGSSALIDPNVHKVVNVWNAATTQGQQRSTTN